MDVDETWTINDLVEEVARRIAALPKPQNGQVRAVPDDRTIRYYATIGLLDRPAAMRGRTALYNKRHVAQVVAIKRMQTMGRSLAEIQAMWPTLDDTTLARMSGIELPGAPQGKSRAARQEFWKTEPAREPKSGSAREATRESKAESGREATRDSLPPLVARALRASASHDASAELRIELAPNLSLSIALSSDIAVSLADVAAIRAAAAPLIAELARRQLAVHAEEAEGDDV